MNAVDPLRIKTQLSKGAICGAVYGVSLTAVGLVAAGSGHGSYLPLKILGALSLLPLAMLFAPIVVWETFGGVVGATRPAGWLADSAGGSHAPPLAPIDLEVNGRVDIVAIRT